MLYSVTYYAAITLTILGAVLGLCGLWLKDFFDSDIGWKLFITDWILAGSAVIVAAITKWLG